MRLDEIILGKPNAFIEARKVNCPLCGVEAGKFCVSIKPPHRVLSTLHTARLRAAGFGAAKGFNAKAKPINAEKDAQ